MPVLMGPSKDGQTCVHDQIGLLLLGWPGVALTLSLSRFERGAFAPHVASTKLTTAAVLLACQHIHSSLPSPPGREVSSQMQTPDALTYMHEQTCSTPCNSCPHVNPRRGQIGKQQN